MSSAAGEHGAERPVQAAGPAQPSRATRRQLRQSARIRCPAHSALGLGHRVSHECEVPATHHPAAASISPHPANSMDRAGRCQSVALRIAAATMSLLIT